MFGKNKSYESIVAPLKKMESDLSEYIGNQGNNITVFKEKRKAIDMKIETANNEIKKSEFTVIKITELLGNG